MSLIVLALIDQGMTPPCVTLPTLKVSVENGYSISTLRAYFPKTSKVVRKYSLRYFDNLNLELKDLADQGSTLSHYCHNYRTDCGRWFACASIATLASINLLTGSKALPIS
ncbi:MAG: hypothetical protein ACO4B0_14300 [bacterium]